MITSLAEKGWTLAQKAGGHVPFTYWFLIRRRVGRYPGSVLDLGCADGDLMGFLAIASGARTVGVDIHQPYLAACGRLGTHTGSVLGDVRKLPIKDKSFDVVMLLETVEHLDKEIGASVIQAAERIARRQVIISTPVVRARQSAYSDNPHQEHRSAWSPEELRGLGYSVVGIGLPETRLIAAVRNGLLRLADRSVGRACQSSENGSTRAVSCGFKLLDFALRLPYYLLPGPVAYFFPGIAGHMVCTKRVSAEVDLP